MTHTVIKLEAVRGKLDAVLPKLAKARVAYLRDPSDITKTVLEEAQAEAIALKQEYSQLVSLIPTVTGLSQDELDALAQEARGTRRTENRLTRESLTRNEIKPTAWIEDYPDVAIERVKSILPPRWLEEEPRPRRSHLRPAISRSRRDCARKAKCIRFTVLDKQSMLRKTFCWTNPSTTNSPGPFWFPRRRGWRSRDRTSSTWGGEREERLNHLWKGPSG